MKTPLTRKKETGIALAMGQERGHNPAQNLNSKGVRKQGFRVNQTGPRRGLFGNLPNLF